VVHQAVDGISRYFEEHPSELAYIASVDVNGNAKVCCVATSPENEWDLRMTPMQALQTVVAQGKKLGKSVYVFSVDLEANKVVHVNSVDPSLKAKGLDARAWANNAAAIVGGKVRVSLRAHIFIYSSDVCRLVGKKTGPKVPGQTSARWTKPWQSRRTLLQVSWHSLNDYPAIVTLHSEYVLYL
jgi:hypothetical protein